FFVISWFRVAPTLKSFPRMTSRICALLLSVSLLPISTASPSTVTAASAVTAGPTVVNCGAGRRAVVTRAVSNGRTIDRVRCMSYARGRARVERPYHRSWKKTALVIGGSSAAGAGIGALAGGKKGALIGAAVGA